MNELRNPKLLIVVNDAAFFVSHRLPLAERARAEGYEVSIATGHSSAVDEIIKLGFRHFLLPLSRSGTNIFLEIKLFIALFILLHKVKPDVLHLVTIKPVLYGGILARITPVKGVVCAVSGLGFIFLSPGIWASIRRGVIGFLYGVALGKKNLKVIFQNQTDRNEICKLAHLNINKTVLIRGSGVDLAKYPVVPAPAGNDITVTFAARLLWDKGVYEYIQAAHSLRSKYNNVSFQLVGDIDSYNPSSLTESYLTELKKERFIDVVGYRKDISNVFAQSHIIVLPSYREGLPKVLIEAAACGRPVVTTDVPGCRDAIEANVTGLLVPLRDSENLALAIERLILDSALRDSMGQKGRLLAEKEFAIEKIVDQHLEIYEGLRSWRD